MTGKSIGVLSAILVLQMLVSLSVTAGRLGPRMNFVRYATLANYFPLCKGPEACKNQTLDPILLSADFEKFDLTESQVNAACKDIRDQVICQMQYADCVQEDMRPLVAPIQAALTKQGAICDDANLYADFQAIKSCVMSMQKKLSESHMSHGYSPVMAFSTCPYLAIVAGKSTYDELMRIGAFSMPMRVPTSALGPVNLVKPAEILHGVCCAGRATVGCGITTVIGDSCSSDAVTAIKRQMENTLTALNCPAITAARPCKMAFDF